MGRNIVNKHMRRGEKWQRASEKRKQKSRNGKIASKGRHIRGHFGKPRDQSRRGRERK